MWVKIWITHALLAVSFLSLANADGKESNRFAYEKDGNIFLNLAGKTSQLTKSGRDRAPILSPDSRWIAFNREIEGKVKECSERDDLLECPSDELWIFDLENKSEKRLLKPRTSVTPQNRENIIFQFNGKEFSPDSQTIYFITPAWAVSTAIHAVNIDGENERYVMHGYSFTVVQKPLSPKIKEYLVNLKEDDWRIFPKNGGASLIEKALNDDINGYLIIKRSGVKIISSITPLENGWQENNGVYYKSMGRKFWTELISPDGKEKIPLDERIW